MKHVTQAERIFAKFGGIDAMVQGSEELGDCCHRLWFEGMLRRGVILEWHWPAIRRLARLKGVRITKRDMDPQATLPANVISMADWRATHL